MSDYAELAAQIVAEGLLTDPWYDGQPRFQREPVVLTVREAEALAEAGRALAAIYDEAVRLCHDEPALLDDFFGLTPVQKVMFLASAPMWHGIARADVFRTTDGELVAAELNCDTPTGQPEALLMSRLARPLWPNLLDPNQQLEARFVAMVERVCEALVGPRAPRTCGLIYPTELPEDLGLVKLYTRWLEAQGWRVVLGSPFNLVADGDRVRMFDEPVSLLLRHYKSDWWSERASAWSDEHIPDAAPLHEPLRAALGAQAGARAAIINPFGAVLPQNKRTMAFFWEHIHRFSLRSQEHIRTLVPVSSRLEALHPAMLEAQQADWVLKSDYGAEGDEVVIGRQVTAEEWARACALTRPGRWIAQRYFDAVTDEAGRTTNLGVYLVAGEPSGLYARLQAGATDSHAVSAPVLIDPGTVGN